MSYRIKLSAVLTLCCLLSAVSFAAPWGTCPYGNKHQVNISGATLFVSFFHAPASTNDAIDVDCDGLYDFDPYNLNLPDQLAFSDWTSTSSENRWQVQYRGLGSGNGLKELDLFYNTAPPGPGDPNYILPSDEGIINRTTFCMLGVLQGPGNPANPGGDPVIPERVDAAVMDVPPTWFVQDGNQADAYWHAHPQDHINGYGRCPITSWDTAATNKLKTLTNLNLNKSSPNAQTIFDFQVAWVPIAIIANQGTGLQNVTQDDLQHLFLAGRMSSGENLYAATRDPGSGTRNGSMNSLGMDPSWARGDNMGTKSNDGTIAYIGPKHQQNNLDGSGIMEDAVTNQRLGVGYTGLVGSSRAIGDATAGLYEILNVKKTGATQYVRPSPANTVDNLDPNTGWQIGGNETFATVGDPNPGSGHPAMINPYAADYLWNIKASIDAFVDPATVNDMNNMPGQYLAANFSLAAALKAIPSEQDPSVFVSNPGYVDSLNRYYKAHGPATPAYGTYPTGKVPNRTDGPHYSDGTTGAHYLFSDGVIRNDGTVLNARNRIMGDFNNDGKRDITDINSMMAAIAHPRRFEPGTGVCPEIIGDFTADGNFTTADIRYFADGLAVIDTGNGKQLNRSIGFAMVDQFWTAARADANHPIAGNFFSTTLAGGRPYKTSSGWSKADIVGSNWKTVSPKIGYTPSADGKIDANDIDYLCYVLRGGLKAKYFGTTLPVNYNVYLKSWHWDNLDDAVYMDLSCDLNGDLIVDFADIRMLVEDILGTHFGDVNLDGKCDATDLAIATAHLGQQGGWAQGDMDGDGWITENDLTIIKNCSLGLGGSGSPDLNGDGKVDFKDFAIFAESWLEGV